MPTAKKKTAVARPVKKAAAPKGKGAFRKLWNAAVLLLALYGVHALLGEYVPAYRPWVEQTVRSTQEGVSSTAESVEKKLAPEPTITIHGADDLAKTPYDNLAVGVPDFRCDVILDRMGYALGYVERIEQPSWVSYRLTADEVRSKKAERADNFRSDPDIPSGSAAPADYKGTPYDRGHLAPAADMSFSVQAMSESFYMSNMSPQEAQLNRGAWKELEAWTRNAALKTGGVFVVSGPVFYADQQVLTIGANRVAVPHAYYKVVLDCNPPECKAIGFILPNDDCQQPLSSYAVTVDHVERVTGLNFFNKLDPALEMQVEGRCDFAAWPAMKPKR